MRARLTAILVVVPTITLAVPTLTVAPAAPQAIAITDVTVIDTRGGPPQPHMTVVIQGHRISEASGSAVPPRGAVVVNGSGKFLIPGLWDMHVHSFWVGRLGDSAPWGRDVLLPLFVANGVTGIRDMGSTLDAVLQAREDVARGSLDGPRMVISGPMLDGPTTSYLTAMPVATGAAGRDGVDLLAGRGADFIKVQSKLPRDVYFAIADEARRRRIPFAGHVPDSIRLSEAVSAGQRSFEHLIGVFEGSSTVEDQFVGGADKTEARFLDTYDASREAALATLLAQRGGWQCPTLYWDRVANLIDTLDVMNNPDARYLPVAWSVGIWSALTKSLRESLEPAPIRAAYLQHELDVVRRLHASGVPFLAGTDTPSGVDLIPGVTLHHELEQFVAAGFTPLEALQTATINPARFLNRTNDLGSVQKGKIADLVLLNANPLTDIRNTRNIDSVIADGRYYSRDRLNTLLADIETAAKRH